MSGADIFGGLTVLLAEDMDISRRATSSLLTRLGVGQVVEVANGREALDYLTGGGSRVDLVIADIDMPRMDGLTLAQKVRKGDEGADAKTRFVMLTSNTKPVFREAADMRGVLSFLEKPATLEKLRIAIDGALRS